MPLSPSETRELLEKLGHRPVRKLGQNFLVDGNIVRKSLEWAEVQDAEPVVEVGPGLGTLTEALLAARHQVHAIEYDPRLHAYLKTRFQPQLEAGQLVLSHGDAVHRPRADLDADSPCCVISNLPYAITSPWLDRLLQGNFPRRLVLMLQKEAADRLTASPNTSEYGAISVFLQSAYRHAGKHSVNRRCFFPAPEVDSTLLKLDRIPQPFRFSESDRQLVRKLFTQRRKQLGALVRGSEKLEKWLELAEKSGIKRTSRPGEVPVSGWQLLAAIP